MKFKLVSKYKPTGDQPEAIEQLVNNILNGIPFQVLLGVTGSGKTFTIANVIERLQRPVLVLSHNKTLAAQLFGEFKQFFPENAVEYFISYYDYYQPEAYIPVTDTYIEKDLSINSEIEKLRLSATSALLSGRRDVIVVSSVSCIYGIGNPEDFYKQTISLKKGMKISRNLLLHKLVDSLYSREDKEVRRATFRVSGDVIDIYVAYGDYYYRLHFWGDEIEEIETYDIFTNKKIDNPSQINIYPASIFVTSRDRIEQALYQIAIDLEKQVNYFKEIGKDLEAKRLYERVTYDMEMIRELGYCSGIENYSRYFDGRLPGVRPFCLLDYFPDDFITIIDESHVTIPQLHAMYGGDHSRKQTLVEYGFRLPAALDNRPLRFDEFEQLIGQTIFVSATPGEYELQKSEGIVVEQLIRPTGLLDPEIEVRPTLNQIEDLIKEINIRVKNKERVLVTTLTKRMAEELTDFLIKYNIKCRYIHSDIDTLDRIEILEGLRNGDFDVLIGINLLREGLDLPEVSLVAILDADKEGFLRSERSLTQIAGRAARNVNGKVIMYADKITVSMQKTIDETNRRRAKQIEYNKKHNITPKPIIKGASNIMHEVKIKTGKAYAYVEPDNFNYAADPVIKYLSETELKKLVEETKRKMLKAAEELKFLEAAKLRDEMLYYIKILEEKTGKSIKIK